MKPETSSDVLVCGAGPAGLSAAIAAAEAGASVTLIDAQPEAGRKLCAAGGGRGNLTNRLPVDDFLASYGREGRFAAPALHAFGPEDLCDWMAALGEPVTTEGDRVYPLSQSARRVRDALFHRAGKTGVRWIGGDRVEDLVVKSGRAGGAVTRTGFHEGRAVVLALGGRAYSGLGGSADGCELARRTGHTVVDPVPSLVALIAAPAWIRELAGLSVDPVRVRVEPALRDRGTATGSLLFTHQGLSGPAVLDLSGAVTRLLADGQRVAVDIDFSPGVTTGDWVDRFAQAARTQGPRLVRNVVGDLYPDRFARSLCERCGVPADRICARLEQGERMRLAEALTRTRVDIERSAGWELAMVMRGGVSLRDVDPRTLQSRKVGGLFFAGELLDLDGPCGGFNLQWAFSSGRLAGLSAHAAAGSIGANKA